MARKVSIRTVSTHYLTQYLTTITKQLFDQSIYVGICILILSTASLQATPTPLPDIISQLPDFSFAGYHQGEQSIPHRPVVSNVLSYGAVPSDGGDDTQAFINAIDATSNGVILVPSGIYQLSQALKLYKSNIVLRGEGTNRSILNFTKPFKDVDRQAGFADRNVWPWEGGLLLIGNYSGSAESYLADVSQNASRGVNKLVLSSVDKIRIGDRILLVMTDSDDKSLGQHLQSSESGVAENGYNWYAGKFVRWFAHVTAITGTTVTLDRHLQVDVLTKWQPKILSYQPSVSEIGVEELQIKFSSDGTYPGLNQEEGYNAFFIRSAHDFWIRNVKIVDADTGFFIANSYRATLTGLELTTEKRLADSPTGHDGIELSFSQDILVNNFHIDRLFAQDLTVKHFSTGNVFANGHGRNITLDHAELAPYENLFSNIDVGTGSRLEASRASQAAQPGHVDRQFFWNLTAQGQVLTSIPQIGWPASAGVAPKDLYVVQRNQRLGNTTPQPLARPTRLSVLSRDNTSPTLDPIDARIDQYRKGNAELTLYGPDGQLIPAGTPIEVEQTRHQFLFGSNIFKFNQYPTLAQNNVYKQRFRDIFNFATLGFYWDAYEFNEGDPRFNESIPIAQWCQANGITTKGHPLVWTFEPGWLQNKSTAAAQALMRARITREVSTFAGLLDIWDVVNEPAVGIEQATDRKALAVLSLYKQDSVLGVIQDSFQRARQANPNATLILNDYDTTETFARLVDASLKNGVSIDVIGLQSHMHAGYPGLDKTEEILRRFERFSKPIHFTEVSILSGELPTRPVLGGTNPSWPTTPAGEKRQMAEVIDFYRLLFSTPAVEAITWWDFVDGEWRGAPAGLLREDLTPKPAYHALKQLIKTTWWTHLSATLKQDGHTTFRGFYGDYQVRVNIGSRELTGTFGFDRKTPSRIQVRLHE